MKGLHTTEANELLLELDNAVEANKLLLKLDKLNCLYTMESDKPPLGLTMPPI